MTDGEVRVEAEVLDDFARKVFIRLGLPPDDAETEAKVLIWANLRGVDSHGVMQIPGYVRSVEAGIMNPTPNVRIEKETPATILIDADQAFGPVVTTMAMDRLIEKAKIVGIGWALIRHTTHQGAMGYYPLMAANQGLAGIAVVCGAPEMAPHGARVAAIHNNPIAIAVPGKRHKPLILDMATSVAAGGKVQLAIEKGIAMPEGWALDKDGNPTTDPQQVAALLPFGGPKGSGLSIMFACLSSLMVGELPLLAVPDGQSARRGIQNSFLAAIDIATFTDVETYKEHVDSLIDGLKALPKAEGVSEIFVPGELEDRSYEDRVQHGIPLPKSTLSNLRAVAEKLEIEPEFLTQ
jgi:ureidoglycolate dehydrogenase (NAD+)